MIMFFNSSNINTNNKSSPAAPGVTAGSRWPRRSRRRGRHTASTPRDKARAVSEQWTSILMLFCAAVQLRSPAQYGWEHRWAPVVRSNPRTDTKSPRTLFFNLLNFRLLWIKKKKSEKLSNKSERPIWHFHLLVQGLVYGNREYNLILYFFF